MMSKPTAVAALVAFALLAPTADAGASAATTPEASTKQVPCKKAKRRPARGAADTAVNEAKKCKKAKPVVLRRSYRGKTSQGEPIDLQTTNRGTKVTLGFYAKHLCRGPFAGPPFMVSDEFNTLGPQRLTNTKFTAKIPAFDAEFPYVASVTGRAGATTASGQISVSAGGQVGEGGCDATSFTFNIPKVRESRGQSH